MPLPIAGSSIQRSSDAGCGIFPTTRLFNLLFAIEGIMDPLFGVFGGSEEQEAMVFGNRHRNVCLVARAAQELGP